MTFQSTKTYTPEAGLSCCFRQWKATHSHCSKLHGYSLGFRFTFEADELDSRGWVVDFGDLKELKELLVRNFDHRTIIAQDDPQYDVFVRLFANDIIDLNVVESVGCEAFAKLGFKMAYDVLKGKAILSARVISCECFEHAGNSAIYIDN